LSISSDASGINDAGQVVGSSFVGGVVHATEWSDGGVIDLGGLPGFIFSEANSINDAGQVVGYSQFPLHGIPETSTWAMMLLGFAGLAWAGYRRAKAGHATLAR
jgi:probable HAF family extracellular repeat protein